MNPNNFAVLDPARQREIASRGGKAAHEKGKAHKFTSEEAREAGRRGGKTISKRGYNYMSELGRRGGKANAARRSA